MTTAFYMITLLSQTTKTSTDRVASSINLGEKLTVNVIGRNFEFMLVCLLLVLVQCVKYYSE